MKLNRNERGLACLRSMASRGQALPEMVTALPILLFDVWMKIRGHTNSGDTILNYYGSSPKSVVIHMIHMVV